MASSPVVNLPMTILACYCPHVLYLTAIANNHSSGFLLSVLICLKTLSNVPDADCRLGHGYGEIPTLALDVWFDNIKTLLAKDIVDPDCKDRYDQTPMLLAAGNGHEAVLKLLLAKNPVDARSTDKFGRTPLSWALRWTHGYSRSLTKRIEGGGGTSQF
jgi:ankyrin repeat protein